LMTHCPTLQADLLFVKPNKMNDAWVKADLWSIASAFPRCHLIVDADEVLSSKFGANNSGQVYLYDPQGQLAYCGGITKSRGHAGDNDGVTSIIAIVNQETKISNHRNRVFGCSLFADKCVSKSNGDVQ
jgi:hypothetical protein